MTPFKIKGKQEEGTKIYRTLYLPEKLKAQVDKLANDNGASFNEVLVEMIEYCLESMKDRQG